MNCLNTRISACQHRIQRMSEYLTDTARTLHSPIRHHWSFAWLIKQTIFRQSPAVSFQSSENIYVEKPVMEFYSILIFAVFCLATGVWSLGASSQCRPLSCASSKNTSSKNLPLPVFPPAANSSNSPTIDRIPGWTYRGCWTDSVTDRTLVGKVMKGRLSVKSCAEICRGFRFFGVEYSNE